MINYLFPSMIRWIQEKQITMQELSDSITFLNFKKTLVINNSPRPLIRLTSGILVHCLQNKTISIISTISTISIIFLNNKSFEGVDVKQKLHHWWPYIPDIHKSTNLLIPHLNASKNWLPIPNHIFYRCWTSTLSHLPPTSPWPASTQRNFLSRLHFGAHFYIGL